MPLRTAALAAMMVTGVSNPRADFSPRPKVRYKVHHGAASPKHKLIQEAFKKLREELGANWVESPRGDVEIALKWKFEAEAWCADVTTSWWGKAGSMTPCCAPPVPPLGRPTREVLEREVVQKVSQRLQEEEPQERWILRLSRRGSNDKPSFLVEGKDAPQQVEEGGDVVMLGVPRGQKAKVQVGSCSRELDETAAQVDLASIASERYVRHQWKVGGQPTSVVFIGPGEPFELTLSLADATRDAEGVVRIPCSGGLSASIGDSRADAKSGETWTWPHHVVKTDNGLIVARVKAAESDEAGAREISIQHRLPWWRSLWARLVGAVLALAALAGGLREAARRVRELRSRNGPEKGDVSGNTIQEFRHLPQPRIGELIQAFVDTGMATHRRLDDLNRDMNRAFAARLDTEGAPLDRLLRTLADLNRIERLADGSVPMAQWLGAAEPMMATFEQVVLVRAALRDVQRAGPPAPRIGDHPVPAGFERTKSATRTDMLPIGFLADGVRTSRSVARLLVPRFERGQQVTVNGEPAHFLGTGWLLTPDLLLTNHHVVNARGDSETAASEADLGLQARGTKVQFDFETPDADPMSQAVDSLQAWSPLDGPLDYAILRLAVPQDTTRPPLRLRRDPLKLPPDIEDYPSLNIVQHPLGGPKMVAFRNNQVVQVSEGDLWYYTDTQRGSSGSPVLDDRWRVVALHKKWTWATGLRYQGKSAAWVNVGTQIASILSDLSDKGSPLLGEILRQPV